MARFRPGLWPTIGAVAGLAILLSLGTWQAVRYRNKLATEKLRDARIDDPPRDVDSAAGLTPDDDWHLARATGEVDTRYTFVVRHRIHDEHPGAWVFQPLVFDDGTAVLVNRGFVPMEREREMARSLEAPDQKVLEGLVHTPTRIIPDDAARKKYRGAKAKPGQLVVLTTLDIDLMYDMLDNPGPKRPTILILGPSHSGNPYPVARYDYVTHPFLTSQRHLSYAGFWFTLAAALLALYVGYGFGKIGGDPRIIER